MCGVNEELTAATDPLSGAYHKQSSSFINYERKCPLHSQYTMPNIGMWDQRRYRQSASQRTSAANLPASRPKYRHSLSVPGR